MKGEVKYSGKKNDPGMDYEARCKIVSSAVAVEPDYLSLKWGTLKGWRFHAPEAEKLLKEYFALGVGVGAMAHKDSRRQREIILELIEIGTFKEIYLDWDDRFVSKQEAKGYILNYGKKEDQQ